MLDSREAAGEDVVTTHRQPGLLGAIGGISNVGDGLMGWIGAAAGTLNPKKLACGMTKLVGAAADAVKLAKRRQLCFPLDVGKKSFNSNYEDDRPSGRLHAGCDLIVAANTPVRAMQDGEVVACERDFFVVTPGGHQVVRKGSGWGRAVLNGAALETKTRDGKKWYVIDETHEYTEDQFFRTDAVAIRHDNFCDLGKATAVKPPLPDFVVRYGEIRLEARVRTGAKVKRGDVIGKVAQQLHNAMLHLEMYKGTESGPLTDKGSTDAKKRRPDVTDPTPYLEAAVLYPDLGRLDVRA